MSKIYNEYLKLKQDNPDKLYLFHNGKFYIFISEDADTINQYVVLKQTKFTNEVNKCGFPDVKLEDYMRVFHNHKLDIQIVETKEIEEIIKKNEIPKKYIKLEQKLKNIDINTLTPLEAINFLYELKVILND